MVNHCIWLCGSMKPAQYWSNAISSCCLPVMCTMQADPSNVRAATRAATCHLKMDQLTEAAHILDAVTATVTASGRPLPPELVSKQNDLQTTKRLVSQVHSHAFLSLGVCMLFFQSVNSSSQHNLAHRHVACSKQSSTAKVLPLNLFQVCCLGGT